MYLGRMRESLDLLTSHSELFETEYDLFIVKHMSSKIEDSINQYLNFVDDGRVEPSQWEVNNSLGDISMRLIPIIQDSTEELDNVGITLMTSDGTTLSQKLLQVLMRTE